MEKQPNRRAFLAGGGLAAGGVLVSGGRALGETKQHSAHTADHTYPRDNAGPGGPVGAPNDRGKLVAGLRSGDEPAVPVETPDIDKLSYAVVDGVKEFHLHAQPVKRELLPDEVMNHWGYNGSMPGPTIEVFEGDRVRIVLHNELPEPTTLHLHGIELPNRLDGVEFVTQEPIMPGATGTYELTLHQNGTFFYHPHMAMQEAVGMVGLFIIHPRTAHQPVVDQDFAIITQEFDIGPAVQTPATAQMPADFNWFTINGRTAPYVTPLVIRLGNRVRIRILNFSTEDHHPVHLHGHTFWVTGTEGGRIPDTAWIPGNNVLVGVAQVREVEFVANNPGDWVMHCHMFHHMMNHMEPGVGPGSRNRVQFHQASTSQQHEHGKMDHEMPQAKESIDPYRVPGYPQDAGMHAMMSKAQIEKLTSNPLTRGMAPQWFMGVMGLMTVVRVLPPDLYDQVVSGTGDVPAGASVPDSKFSPAMHMEH